MFVLRQFILGFSVVSHSPVTYGDYVYPGWAIGVGWVFALCSMIPLPLIMLIKLSQADGTLVEVSSARQADGTLVEVSSARRTARSSRCVPALTTSILKQLKHAEVHFSFRILVQ